MKFSFCLELNTCTSVIGLLVTAGLAAVLAFYILQLKPQHVEKLLMKICTKMNNESLPGL